MWIPISKLKSYLYLDKNEELFGLLEQTNNKCELMWKIYVKFVISGIFANTIMMSVGSVLLSYIKNDRFIAEDAYHALKFM